MGESGAGSHDRSWENGGGASGEPGGGRQQLRPESLPRGTSEVQGVSVSRLEMRVLVQDTGGLAGPAPVKAEGSAPSLLAHGIGFSLHLRNPGQGQTQRRSFV